MNTIAKISKVLAISFVWFLISPFPFERGGWQWFGGYRILKPLFPYTDGFDHEIDLGRAFYSSSWYPVALLLVSVLLGWVSYLVITKVRAFND
jgi:hypothetical protein